MKAKPRDMAAAARRIIKVMSCNASQTSSKNVFGGFGGITFDPKTSRRWMRSLSDPLRPSTQTACQYYLNSYNKKRLCMYAHNDVCHWRIQGASGNCPQFLTTKWGLKTPLIGLKSGLQRALQESDKTPINSVILLVFNAICSLLFWASWGNYMAYDGERQFIWARLSNATVDRTLLDVSVNLEHS